MKIRFYLDLLVRGVVSRADFLAESKPQKFGVYSHIFHAQWAIYHYVATFNSAHYFHDRKTAADDDQGIFISTHANAFSKRTALNDVGIVLHC
jgi:hypothetical protein